ncbi:heme o synthase [Pullulanibacillus sp. KACC 23026]|uniref:heme o synthase n=1 Tax=Pullulanibacillus sp. KACC 23026 TaxID=3028315 RepID=UPI0023B0FA3E|nr:heme o synthase [Pullulanibacillus sp. KACC 23026]WEG15008.1 heme o synthase [Pullulanibacillus sp. KACC 23026]
MESRSPSAVQTSGTFGDVIGIIKSGIVISNLITTFAGLWLALKYTNQSFYDNIWKVLAVMAGSALVIAGGCALNNYIDRDIDQLMERTKERPSATGQLSSHQVLWVGIIFSAIGLLALLFVNYMAAIIGLIGLFVYIFVYTWWLKRTHSINTVIGGISGAMPPLIGWAAFDPGLHGTIPWVLFLVMFLWQPPHFLALAMKRVEEYRKAGIPMLPVVAGFEFTKRQMIVYVVVLLPVSLFLYQLGPFYLVVAGLLGAGWIGLGIAGFFIKDIMKWSKWMFVYSLNYLTIIFIVMIIAVI